MNETDNALAPRQLRTRTEINIGDMCTSCGRDTGPGSGLFVDRIGSGAEWSVDAGWDTQAEPFTVQVDGWLCADCQCVPCALCSEPVLDWVTVSLPATPNVHIWVCEDCADTQDVLIEE